MNIPREQIEKTRLIDRLLEPQALTTSSRIATVALCGIAILFALHEASALVAPMAAAIVVGIVLSRIVDRAQARGIPIFVIASAFVAVTGVAIALAASAISSRFSSVIELAPSLMRRFSALVAHILGPLQAVKAQISGPPAASHSAPAAPSLDMGAVTGVIGGVTPALGGVLTFLATLFFFVAGKTDLKRKLVLACTDRANRLSALRILNGVEEALAHYFGSATLVYGALAIATALLAWLSGLGAPALWGIFVFVSCFIPFLGVAMVVVALLVAGLSTFDGVAAGLAPAVVYSIVHLAVENAVVPAIVGRRFELNPFLIFISIVFWTWMWGTVGAVIASPLLLIVKIVVDELKESDAPDLPS